MLYMLQVFYIDFPHYLLLRLHRPLYRDTVVTYDNAPFVISRYVSSVLPRFSKGQSAI